VEILAVKLLESRNLDGDRIISRIHVGENEIPRRAGSKGTNALIHLVDDVDLGPRDGGSGRIDDATSDSPTRALGEERSAGE